MCLDLHSPLNNSWWIRDNIKYMILIQFCLSELKYVLILNRLYFVWVEKKLILSLMSFIFQPVLAISFQVANLSLMINYLTICRLVRCKMYK